MIDEYDCSTHQRQLWDFTAGVLPNNERETVASHLGSCRDCFLESEDVAFMHSSLHRLPRKTAPSLLNTRLQVLASKERSRLLLRRTLAIRFREFRSRVKLTFDNLLRPLAVPAAGGVLASFLCFGVLVDTLHIDRVYGNDIPIGLYTSVVLDDASPFSVKGKDAMVLVQLTVDEKGNVSDFTLPQGSISQEEMQRIGNLVLYSSFRPATRFGRPVTSQILVNIQLLSIKG